MTSTQSETPEGGGQVGSADAELLRLEAELLRFIEEIDAGKHPVADDDAGDKPIGRMAEMELVIAQCPAHTPAGVAVKVRRLKDSFEKGKAEWDRPLFNTALDALARLSREQEATDAEIVSMWHEYRAFITEHEAALIAADRAGKTGLDDEKANASFAQASELVERILATQARTPAGIAVKIKLADEVEGFEKDTKENPQLTAPQAVMSALHDLERLSGPFVPAAGDDAELFELHNEWKRLEKAAEKTNTDADWKTAFDTERRFLETPARTLEGVLFKLRYGCESTVYELEYATEDGTPAAPPAVRAALADLERMAGRA